MGMRWKGSPEEGPLGVRQLGRTGRGFRLLIAATAGSSFGTYLAALALSVDIFDRTGSGRWLAALLVADFLPMVVLGLVAGPLIDHVSRRALMVTADVVRALVFVALPFVDGPTAIVALAAVNGVATGLFRPAVWAGVPNLVGERDRPRATSLLSTVEHASWMAGPVVAGVLLAASGPSLAYGVNAATFVLSAALIARIPASALRSDEPVSHGHWRAVADGLGLVTRSPVLRLVLIAWSVAALGSAGVNVAEVVFVKESLGAGNVGLGLLVGATGAGLVVGSVGAPRVVRRLGTRRAYAGSLALMAAGFGLAAAAPSLAVAATLAGLGAVGNGIAIVCNQLLVQRGAPDAMRGRSLAVLMSAYYAMLGLGMAVAGVLTDAVGARATWALAGIAYLVAALLAAMLAGRPSEQERSMVPV